MPELTYPATDLNVAGPNDRTVAQVAASGARVYAELGVYRGATAARVADVLGPDGELHLFDFEDTLAPVVERLRAADGPAIVAHPNSRRTMDSYAWSLMRLLRDHPEPLFDYVYLDGAHTWATDALAFVLADRLLKPGGHVDFDDYTWTLGASPSMRPDVFPATGRLYTDEQIAEPQVALVVDLLVRRDPRYAEVVENKVFRKCA